MTGYDAVLFDSDGVLVEPPPRERQVEATHAAFAAVGVDDPAAEHVEAFVRGPTVETVHEVAAACGVDATELWAAREEHDERSQFEDFRSGARSTYDDVAAIADCPARRAVVSNNHHSTIEFVLEQFDLGDAFDAFYGREKSIESLDWKKPDTHYLERALAALNVAPGDALFVGDNESDVVAARRAGVDSVFLRRDHCADAALSTAPTHEATSLHDVAELARG